MRFLIFFFFFLSPKMRKLSRHRHSSMFKRGLRGNMRLITANMNPEDYGHIHPENDA